MHALRVIENPAQRKKLYRSVRASGLYDRKLGMYRLNLPLDRESYEVGRNKIFTPGWLENESIFLHMAYKFLLETLRAGLAEEFFDDMRRGLVAFQRPSRYGRSPLENSSFIASSRLPDTRLHGGGFVARLTGATAEWLSIVFYMALGPQPFLWSEGQLRFAPAPTLARWLFRRSAADGFPRDAFGIRLFGRTWLIFHNPQRRDTFGRRPVRPTGYVLFHEDGRQEHYDGPYLPDGPARDLREGRMSRVVVELG
jgi:hypothetical protein